MANIPVNFIASVEPAYRTHIDTIAEKLREKGCSITNVLRINGLIMGCSSGTECSLEELRVTGILHIEEDREVGAL